MEDDGYYSDDSMFSEGIYTGTRDWLPGYDDVPTGRDWLPDGATGWQAAANISGGQPLLGMPLGFYNGPATGAASAALSHSGASWYAASEAAWYAAVHGVTPSDPAAWAHLKRPFYHTASGAPGLSSTAAPGRSRAGSGPRISRSGSGFSISQAISDLADLFGIGPANAGEFDGGGPEEEFNKQYLPQISGGAFDPSGNQVFEAGPRGAGASGRPPPLGMETNKAEIEAARKRADQLAPDLRPNWLNDILGNSGLEDTLTNEQLLRDFESANTAGGGRYLESGMPNFPVYKTNELYFTHGIGNPFFFNGHQQVALERNEWGLPIFTWGPVWDLP